MWPHCWILIMGALKVEEWSSCPWTQCCFWPALLLGRDTFTRNSYYTSGRFLSFLVFMICQLLFALIHTKSSLVPITFPWEIRTNICLYYSKKFVDLKSPLHNTLVYWFLWLRLEDSSLKKSSVLQALFISSGVLLVVPIWLILALALWKMRSSCKLLLSPCLELIARATTCYICHSCLQLYGSFILNFNWCFETICHCSHSSGYMPKGDEMTIY